MSSPVSTVVAITKRIVPSVATRGRLIAMSLVGLLGIIIGLVVRNSGQFDEALTVENDPAYFLSRFGLAIFVPLVALVIASATLGTLREERTLVYFWLRPIGRWQITAASFVAGLLVLVPLIGIPMVILGGVTGDGRDIAAIAIASLVGIVAYGSVFTLLGLLTQRALAWGLVYILVWEGFIAGLSRGAGRFAIRTYTTSALSRVAEVGDLIDNPESMATVVIVTVLLAAACLGFATVRLNNMDVD